MDQQGLFCFPTVAVGFTQAVCIPGEYSLYTAGTSSSKAEEPVLIPVKGRSQLLLIETDTKTTHSGAFTNMPLMEGK